MRQAASLGGISNTTWSRYESGVGQMTPGLVRAVARAFDWPTTWPEDSPTTPPGVDAQAVAQLALQVERLARHVDALQDAVDEHQSAIALLQSSQQQHRSSR